MRLVTTDRGAKNFAAVGPEHRGDDVICDARGRDDCASLLYVNPPGGLNEHRFPSPA